MRQAPPPALHLAGVTATKVFALLQPLPAQSVANHSSNIPILQPNSPALAIHRHALLLVYKYINFNLELLEES